ncbi:alpha/beta fold hydrolase [Alteribacillus sp. YIM 98480]|uniref:alpha/beta fold hydrolase n=1 Tax=Alteribacillus sp. YIM 98480 TaxID=2606599 RepID=UPI001E4C1BE0|nr:alpha/beta fold hydrolase [Alteribacillus sp. YIM 98480]
MVKKNKNTLRSINWEKEKKRWEGMKHVFTEPAPEVGLTPRKAIWKKNKAALWYYEAPEKKYNVPLFLVYSLVNQPFILDLAPGMSMIEAFINEGFDVYLLDFGIPGYEDKDITIDDYVYDYIQKAVKKSLRHSGADEVTVIGYCLGGTLAAMYAAIAEEPIKNLILSVAPIDFSSPPVYDEWVKQLRHGTIEYEKILDMYGTIPARFIEAGMRIASYPIYFSHYASLLQRADDKEYVEKWRRFNLWTKNHIPFSGAALKQLITDLGKDNKLMNGNLMLRQKQANLSNITANLLVVSTTFDTLVPSQMSASVIDAVSSADKTFKMVDGGHATLAANGELPDFLAEWLPQRSEPI